MTLVKPETLVLVVDDDDELRQSVAETLIMEGYAARAVRSADAAWNEISLGARPAVIVLDLWLHGMSSGEFIHRLRGSRHADIPVLVLSAASDTIGLDVEAVARKPIDSATLVAALDKLVASGRGAAAEPAAPAMAEPARRRGRARSAAR